MTRNQASGGVSVSVARSQAPAPQRRGDPGSRAAGLPRVRPQQGGPARGRPAERSWMPSGGCPYPVIWVQALTHCWNGTQSFLPLPHCASGVFQNLMVWKYDSGASAW